MHTKDRTIGRSPAKAPFRRPAPERSWRAAFAWAGVILVSPALCTPSAAAGGLRCSPGEVVIENLEIGREYSLLALANVPLTVFNTGEEAVLVRVEPLRPEAAEVRSGVEPIPDAAWASACPDSFELAPQESKAVELKLRIPDDETLLGRTFQVQFWSHTLPRPGEMLAYGLSSRVLFSIAPVRATERPELKGDFSIRLEPSEIHMSAVREGERADLKGANGGLLTQISSAQAGDFLAIVCAAVGNGTAGPPAVCHVSAHLE
jgi:hypothetical protein